MANTPYALMATLAFAAAPARAIEYNQVQLDKSQVAFVSKQMGVAVDGRFRKFSVQVSFDPAKPEAGRARVDIDLASVDAGSQEANEEVKDKNWFNVKQFPTASFVSSAVKPLGGNRYELVGKLTIKGTSQDMTAPFNLRQEGSSGVFEGSFVLKRLDFAVGAGPWSDTDTVANEVQVKFKFAVAAAAAGK
jgi:polyisoprenoid-binding protein YceI